MFKRVEKRHAVPKEDLFNARYVDPLATILGFIAAIAMSAMLALLLVEGAFAWGSIG